MNTVVKVVMVLCLFLAAPIRAELVIYWLDDVGIVIGTTDECVKVSCVTRIDMLYQGTPEPGIFSDISLYPPFDSFETDGQSYLSVYASQPLCLPEPPFTIPTARCMTVLDHIAPGNPSPFTFVEHDTSGAQCSGVVYVTASKVPTLTEWGVIILTIAMLGMVGWKVLRGRRKAAVRA